MSANLLTFSFPVLFLLVPLWHLQLYFPSFVSATVSKSYTIRAPTFILFTFPLATILLLQLQNTPDTGLYPPLHLCTVHSPGYINSSTSLPLLLASSPSCLTLLYRHVFCLPPTDFLSMSLQSIPPPLQTLSPAPHSPYRYQCHLQTSQTTETPA